MSTATYGYLPVQLTVWVDARTKLSEEELAAQLAADILDAVRGYRYTVRGISTTEEDDQ